MSELVIREMREEDLPQILPLEQESFGARAWQKEVFLRELRNPNSLYLVLELREGDNKKVIGYVGCWMIYDELHVTNLNIASPYRGKGYGRLLLTSLLNHCKENVPSLKEMVLEVETTNQAALKLYESIGLKVVRVRRDYYGEGRDAYVMVGELNKLTVGNKRA